MRRLTVWTILACFCLVLFTAVYYNTNLTFIQLTTAPFNERRPGVLDNMTNAPFSERRPSVLDNRCPSVLDNVTIGRWHQNPMTRSQQMDINKFLIDAAISNKLPVTYERADKKCGNVTYDNRPYFRAICDREGATPCCYNNQCVNRTVEQCRCPNCYDLRDVITPEHTDWIPSDPRCAVRKIDYKGACELLSGYTLTFLGDSIIRQMYTAFLIYIRNNYIDGALVSNISRDIQYNCLRYRVFGESVCRTSLDRNAKACDGKLQLKYQRIAEKRKNHQKDMLKVMKKIPHGKSLLIFGTGGFLSEMNAGRHIKTFLKPVLDLYKSLKKPYKLLWVSPGYYNIIKKPFIYQTNSHVEKYIDGVVPYLRSQEVPILNVRDMSKGILSHDGLHSSLGLNLWKSHILMNYIHELYSSGKWGHNLTRFGTWPENRYV